MWPVVAVLKKREEVPFMKNTRVLVLSGLFLSLNIILTRVVKPIDLTLVKVDFGFLSIAISAIVLGPFLGAINAAIADIIGFFLFPSNAVFFPGFTLSALLSGLIYGLFLSRKPDSLVRLIFAVLTISLLVHLGLNTLWLSIMYKKAWFAFIAPRIVKTVLMVPVQVVLIHLTWKYVGSTINNSFMHKRI